MFENELKDLGLTDNEIKIYLTLLKQGTLGPSELAEKTGLHRSYIYDTLERLLEKGIVNTMLISEKKNYRAVDPKILREIYELKLKQLDAILPKLSSLASEETAKTNIELHKGKKVWRTLLKSLISDMKKGDLIYLVGINEAFLEEIEPIYLRQYFTFIKEKGVKEKIIIARGKKKFREKNLEYKELDEKYI